jgi:hypothetical protein
MDANDPARAVKNLQARNYLNAAAQLVRFAAKDWPSPTADRLVKELEELRTQVKAELTL